MRSSEVSTEYATVTQYNTPAINEFIHKVQPFTAASIEYLLQDYASLYGGNKSCTS